MSEIVAHTYETALRPGEVKKVFPRVWLSGAMTPNHVDEVLGDDAERATTTYGAIGFGWTSPRLEHLVLSKCPEGRRAEYSTIPRSSWRLVVYRIDETSDDLPVGFIAFTPCLRLNAPGGEVSDFELVIHHLWVAPAARGQGFGGHVAAHLVRYLAAHPIACRGRTVVQPGLRVIVKADSRLKAARSIISHVYEFFELQREMTMLGAIGFSRYWLVQSVQWKRD